MVPILFSVWEGCIERLAVVFKFDDNDTGTVFVSYMSDCFLRKGFDKLEHVNYNV